MTEQQLINRIVNASKWSAFSEITSQAIRPLLFIILARLLTPEDYGVVAIAAMIISFSQVFWDAGLSKALIQREEDTEKTSNIVFWTNAALGVLIYVIVFVSAGFIAKFFKDPRVILVIQVQSLQIIIASLYSVQTALYQRQLNFRTLFWTRFITAVIPGVASIPLAYAGYGYWALVGGTLLGSMAQLIVLWKASPWRPRLEYDIELAKQLFSFGIWVTVEGLLSWFILWVDSIIIGNYLGSHYLGLYRTGNNFITMIFGLLINPLMPVLFSSFSRMQQDLEQLRNVFLKVSKLIAMIALPVGIGSFLIAEPLVAVIFGDKWHDMTPVIGFMGIMHGLSWLVGTNAEVYRAIGRPDLNTKIMFISLIYYLPAYLAAIPHGFITFLWARLGVACLSLPIHILVARKYLNLKILYFVANLKWVILASIMMSIGMQVVGKVAIKANETVILSAVTIIGSLIFILSLLPEIKFIKNITFMLIKGRKNDDKRKGATS